MKLALVLIIVAACSWCCEAQDGARYYCGRHLARVIAALCWGAEEKRATGSWGPEERPTGLWGPEEHATGWWRRQGAARALGGVRGKRDGVADECCNKPCTLEELRSYC
ncbi:hypothetical protein PYW08_015057 [Mythimna loreyi]|uniref:Uncharacterized protein n=1 Tax=Mythimna loreyi TaxID=667449 RepID=A0ACC2R456_9NEOP|nr:hypothetical protein PYW08_015057 [Mythimna loreyi]